MKLSIFCLVYNHEKYLQKALDGFLMQTTNFDFEIVVGEDCSTDNSRSILLEYKEKYPTKFKLLLHEKNIGMAENVIATLGACTGEYVALCEGDDYWTDPLKLQKQVDFLDQNQDFSICYHRVMMLNDVTKLFTEETINTSAEEKEFDILHLATGNKMHTPSVVFRNYNLSIATNPRFRESPVSDYFLHMLNAQYGKIKCLPDFMGVYRVNSTSSVWSSLKAEEMYFNWSKVLQLLLTEFSDLETVKKALLLQYLNLYKRISISYSTQSDDKLKQLLKKGFQYDEFTDMWLDHHTACQINVLNQFAVERNSIKKTAKRLFDLLKRNLFNV